MGDDPARSVVDRWCMSHDVPNLGIIDGSVFVTSSTVNPTSTICALALRAAERLISQRACLPKPSHERTSTSELQAATRPAIVQGETAPPALQLTDPEVGSLVAIADLLIPADGELPGAGQVLAGGGLDAVLSVRPDLAELIKPALTPSSDALLDDLAALESADPVTWEALTLTIAGGYFADARVRAHIGYEGQVARPQRPERDPAAVREGLLDHLFAADWHERWRSGETSERARPRAV
jgi:hypothetical protein